MRPWRAFTLLKFQDVKVFYWSSLTPNALSPLPLLKGVSLTYESTLNTSLGEDDLHGHGNLFINCDTFSQYLCFLGPVGEGRGDRS